jgi:hypothetical protein
MERDLIEIAARALADTYAEKDGAQSEDELRGMIEQATQGLRGQIDLAPDELTAVLNTVGSRPSFASGVEYTRRQVARWFEVPLDEFDQLAMSHLDPQVLFRHMHYERLISGWFADWGYDVEVGEELEGAEGTDFIPDVYAQLSTLHGNFQVAVTLFCSQPPNTWRVLGMLENLEAFAPRGSEFGKRDIYLMVTPYKFLEQASNHIRIQVKEEDYYVVAIEGDDLQDLEQAQDAHRRIERLQEHVRSVSRVRDKEPF